MEKMLLTDVQYSTIDALLLMHVGSRHCLCLNILVSHFFSKNNNVILMHRVEQLVYLVRGIAPWFIGNYLRKRTIARRLLA